MGLERLSIVDDDRSFAADLRVDGERLGLDVEIVHEGATFENVLQNWAPAIIAMDLVVPGSDGLELIRVCDRSNYRGALI